MSTKDFECFRRVIILSYIASQYANRHTSLDLNTLSLSLSIIYNIEVFSSFRTFQLTKEYKELKLLYGEVVSRITALGKGLELTHPIEIFSFYVYLLRNGYLSYGQHFEFRNNGKDLPNLLGLDVVNGHAVCRSISTMLTDVYNSYELNATNLCVKATADSCRQQQKLCDTELNHKYHFPFACKSKDIANIEYIFNELVKLMNKDTKPTSTIIQYINNLWAYLFPFGNHMITSVIDGDYHYILDPTNDGLLYKGFGHTVVVPNTSRAMALKNWQLILLSFLGIGKYDANIINLYKRFQLKQISAEEYTRIYRKTLLLCQANISLFKDFYEHNTSLYEDIYQLGSEQRGLFGRALPFVPTRKLTK